jgi:hypothetical protein
MMFLQQLARLYDWLFSFGYEVLVACTSAGLHFEFISLHCFLLNTAQCAMRAASAAPPWLTCACVYRDDVGCCLSHVELGFAAGTGCTFLCSPCSCLRLRAILGVLAGAPRGPPQICAAMLVLTTM